MYDIITEEDGTERVVDAFSGRHLPDEEGLVLVVIRTRKKEEPEAKAEDEDKK
jgi:hypothetical protein